jgi:3-hydroxyisobutyrate dehydrogenase-like beta-hydroxyacid dehydrogenase
MAKTTIETVGILSPGAMGSVVGRVLIDHGLRVVTSLEGRSERTQGLADAAGVEDLGSIESLVGEVDILLSILVPAQAGNAARTVASALACTDAQPLYVDCNAIAPQTAQQIGKMLTASGARFVDASIIGPPPREPGSTRFYAAGPHAGGFAALGDYGLDVIVLGGDIGQASAIKMCYAALTKGLTALGTELLTAAEVLGVLEPLQKEFRTSQATLYERLACSVTRVPVKSRRFAGEMEEIAKTFGAAGLTPKIHAGAADVYRRMGETPLADRTPEDTSPPPTLEEALAVIAEHLGHER